MKITKSQNGIILNINLLINKLFYMVVKKYLELAIAVILLAPACTISASTVTF